MAKKKTFEPQFLVGGGKVLAMFVNRRWGNAVACSTALVLSLMLSAVRAPAQGTNPDAATSSRLFHIERSSNSNIIVYEVRIDAQGQLDLKKPVDAYWLRLAEQGQRAELSWFQRRMAYGFGVLKPVTAEGFGLQLTAVKERPLRVEKASQGYRATTQIGHSQARLERVFVQVDESGAFPKVQFIELFGVDLKSGKLAHETLQP